MIRDGAALAFATATLRNLGITATGEEIRLLAANMQQAVLNDEARQALEEKERREMVVRLVWERK